jgi:hypothetical protein
LVLGAADAADADILDRRSTEVRLADWMALDPAARSWWLIGFALGWHGTDPAAAAVPPEAARAGQADAMAELAHRATDAEDRGRRLAALLVADRLAGALPLARVTGHVWMGLAVGNRLMLLQGVQAGAYGRAVSDALGEMAGGDALDAALAQARRQYRPRLGLAPNVLFARLSDYYFYTDRRDELLVASIATIAAQLGRK